MPNKQLTSAPYGHVADAYEAQNLRQAICGILQSFDDRIVATMPEDLREQLVTNLTLAGISVRAGIRVTRSAQGSRVKRSAWERDLLARDVSWAAWRAGLPIGADPDPTVWPAQRLAREIAALLGLTEDDGTVGSFYHSMQRAARSLSASAPEDGIAQAWLDGRLFAVADTAGSPSLSKPETCRKLQRSTVGERV
jgi:hypothetical protein